MTLDTAIALCAIVLVMLWPIHQELTIRALRHSLRRMHERQAQHARALVHLQTTMANTPLQVHAPMPVVTKVTATISGDRSLQPHSRYDGQSCAPKLVTPRAVVQGSAPGSPPDGGRPGARLDPLTDADRGPVRAMIDFGPVQLADPEQGAYVSRPERKPSARNLHSSDPNESPLDPDQTLRLGRPPSLSDIEGVLDQAGRDLTATEIAARLDRKPWDLIADIDRLIKAGKIHTVPGHTAGRTAYRLAGPPDPTERIPGGMPILWGAR